MDANRHYCPQCGESCDCEMPNGQCATPCLNDPVLDDDCYKGDDAEDDNDAK